MVVKIPPVKGNGARIVSGGISGADGSVPSAQRLIDGAFNGATPASATAIGSSPVISEAEQAALMQNIGYAPERVAAGSAVAEPHAVAPVELVGDAVDLKPIDGAVAPIGAVATVAGFAPMIAVPALGLGMKIAEKTKNTETLGKLQTFQAKWNPDLPDAAGSNPKGFRAFFSREGLSNTFSKEGITNFFSKQRDATPLDNVGNIGFAVSSGVSTYGVAKSFDSQLNSLKHAIADIKGVKAGQISTAQALFGPVPASLKPARDHLFKEHVLRGGAQVGGLIAMVMAVRAKKHINNLALIAPMVVDMGANALLGESVLSNYADIKNAYLSGQPLSADIYAGFLVSASHDLAIRGEVGKMVAGKVGEQYAAEHKDPGAILREIDNGSFMSRIQGIIAEAEKVHAAQMAQAKVKAAEEAQAKAQHKDVKPHGAPGSMVSKVKGEKQSREAVGAFTQRIKDEPTASPSIA